MTGLFDFVARHGWWIFWASVVAFIASALLLPVLVVRMPSDYFVGDAAEDGWAEHHPVIRITVRVVKNLVGGLLVCAGLVMLFTPGQGILTILIGLWLMDLPGKRNLERRLVGSPAVFDAINAIRARARQPPLRLD